MRNQLQKIIGLMMLMVLFGFNSFSQNPTYIMEIKNDVAVSPTEYTFDIYIKNTSVNPTWATSFELQGIQAGIRVNNAIVNGGVIVPTIVAGNSDMVAAQQHTNANLSMSGLTSGVPNANYGVKMTVKSVSVGSGTQILTTEMRVCRIKLTNSVPFTPNSLANLTWNLGSNIPWSTKVSAYLPGAAELQLLSVHSVANRNNPPLNAPTGPAIANVTGGGSYCAGTTPTGVSVGLDASNASYSYQLLKGGVAEGLPVVGTGAALVWNNLPAGVYTVEATTTPAVAMAGSATITELALPATPLVNVVNDCGTSTLTITNPEAGATFLWTGGLTSNPINPTIGGVYTVTQTVGACTSLPSADATAAPIEIPAAPVVSVMNNCGNSDLSTTAVGSLMWSNGMSTPTINVTMGGTYSVTTTVNGCISAASLLATAAPIAIPATPVVSVMDNCGNSDLSTTATGTLLWSNAATTSSINVTMGGTYTVTATENGCTSAAGSGVAAPIAIPAAPTVSVVNNCGNSVLTADNFTGSLLWSTTEITPSITVTAANMYMVTQTVNGCTSAQAFGTAVPVAIPATPVVAVMDNCGNSDLSTTATGTLLWSNAATTSSINVTMGGTYTVTATENGCTSAAGSGVAAPVSPLTPAVVIAADMNNVVAGTTVTFTATPTNGGTPMYQWYVNTLPVGTGLATYAYAPVNGDLVKCVMTSDLACVTTATANSNEITMIITVPGFITNTWLGNTTAWALATNWDLGIVPLANHNVVIPSGVANYPVILAPAVCNDIFLASGAQLINTNTLAIGGTVKVQQYLSANNWHFFSSPINNATAYTFSNVNPNNAGITMYLQKYNESWDGLSGTPWVDVAVGPAEVMSAGKGYEVWSNSNHTVTMEGTQLNSTDVTVPLTWSSSNAALKGYNLIGNPFPSALTVVSSNAWPMNNALAALYLWSAGSGNYLDWDGIGSGSINGIIPANQSFFVRATGPAATYTIPAAAKTFGGSFYKSTVSDRLVLTVNGNNYQDQTTVRFDVNATSNYDSQYDVVKLFGLTEAPQLYSVIQNENLSINALPSLASPVVVPMGFNNGVAGTYSITASEMSSFANGTTIMLEDTKTNTFTNLMQQSVYTFTAVPADNVNRFNLHFGVNGINENNSGNVSIYSNNNVIYVNNTGKDQVKEIVVMNVLGQQIMSKEAANTIVNTITMDVASAYYIVKVITASKVYTEKVYVR